ncbi:hypothetical protein ACWEH1_26590, partial [Micromonospora chersina]
MQRIAPPTLFDRDQELQELAAFCTADDGPPYVWWRAEAWAGKSALMSWFVLNAPAGVRIVSFFITARWAGQSDRAAFSDIVIEQLAELLGESMPSHYTDATRDVCFLDLLDRAAKACAQRGQRLVLLIDGLDEDVGVLAGPATHSIAAMLPKKCPAGMRIILAGRPNPPIPTDVDDDHPLRDPEIIRPLGASSQAAVVRGDMSRELARLLAGTPAEQDLLGLLAAAGGGLSTADLAELTSWSEWHVEQLLTTVAGRSFTPRPSQWQPSSGREVYVLGHEDLQVQAVSRIGERRLESYRRRLHDWADTYSERGWPTDTPEYLLRGYFRMLQATGDVTRMVVCATDSRRHDRMLDITGGDAVALAEIADAQDAILGWSDPDLAAMSRLAVHRDCLARRHASVPPNLPTVWAILGQPNRAEALARSIERRDRQALALAVLAGADAGDPAWAASLLDRAE